MKVKEYLVRNLESQRILQDWENCTRNLNTGFFRLIVLKKQLCKQCFYDKCEVNSVKSRENLHKK